MNWCPSALPRRRPRAAKRRRPLPSGVPHRLAPVAARSGSADGVGRDRGVDRQPGRAAAVRRGKAGSGHLPLP